MLIFLLLAATFTAPSEVTAGDLKEYCTAINIQPGERREVNPHEFLALRTYGWCEGFIYGVLLLATTTNVTVTGQKSDGTTATLHHLFGCIPAAGVAMDEVRLVFLKYVESHPEKLHRPGIEVFQNALIIAYPCGTDKGERR